MPNKSKKHFTIDNVLNVRLSNIRGVEKKSDNNSEAFKWTWYLKYLRKY